MAGKPHIVATSSDGTIAIRTGDDRLYELIRVADNMPLQTIGGLDAAVARAEQIASPRKEPTT